MPINSNRTPLTFFPNIDHKPILTEEEEHFHRWKVVTDLFSPQALEQLRAVLLPGAAQPPSPPPSPPPIPVDIREMLQEAIVALGPVLDTAEFTLLTVPMPPTRQQGWERMVARAKAAISEMEKARGPVDPSRPHQFQGRNDRPCEICGERDMFEMHTRGPLRD